MLFVKCDGVLIKIHDVGTFMFVLSCVVCDSFVTDGINFFACIKQTGYHIPSEFSLNLPFVIVTIFK